MRPLDIVAVQADGDNHIIVPSVVDRLLLGNSLGKVGESLATLELGVGNDTGVSIAGEVSAPGDIGVTLVLAGGDRVGADGADDGGVAQGGLRGDDAVGDVVIDAGVLLLLDLENGAVLEGPLDDVGIGGAALDPFGGLESRVELGEVLELDQVPDVAEGGFDDGGLEDRGGGGNGRHDCGCLFVCEE
ncbi:hypothetical protein HG530_010487 [Fusarium avenaceum]|nr:hypothetical protein HG530_010487 [Fusarium avenaceum]